MKIKRKRESKIVLRRYPVVLSAEAFREFLRINDECADKIYDIRERSDLSREWLLNSDGVAPRFYQLEADAVRSPFFSLLSTFHPSF